MIDLWSSVKFLLIRFPRFSKTISSNPKYVLCSDWQLSYLQNELCFKRRIRAFVKVIYPKYSKHWPFTVAHTIHTIYCVCSKILNHGLFLSHFKLIPCPVYFGIAFGFYQRIWKCVPLNVAIRSLPFGHRNILHI